MIRRLFLALLTFALVVGSLSLSAAPAFVVRPASSMEKIFRDSAKSDWVSADFGGTIDVTACRNERESVQAVILPLRPLTNVRWRVASSLGEEAVTVAPVAYVEIPKNSPRFPVNYPAEDCFPGWWPDPIQYGEDHLADVPARQCQPLWILVDVPPGASAGRHTIRVDISADGVAPVPFTVNVRVYDFALPERMTLKTSFWTDESYLRVYYRGIQDLAPVERGFLKMALDNRITPVSIAWMGNQVDTRVTEQGEYVLDYSRLETWLAFVLDDNPRKGNLAALSMHSLFAYKDSPASWPITGNDGKVQPRKVAGAELEKLLESYFRGLQPLMARRNWERFAYFTICDEPKADQEPGIRWARELVRRAYPGLPVVSAGNFMPAQKKLDPYIDIWAPGFFSNAFGKAELPYWQQLQKDGREVWGYVCYKNFCIDYQPIDMRINPWLCWKHDLKGFLYWGIVNWSSAGGPQKHPEMFVDKSERRWPKGAKWQPTDIDRAVAGDGYLMYPGPNGQAWSSIRLENFRDGVEDYEYLAILKQLTARLEKRAGASAELLAQARALLVVGDDLVADHITYTRDASRLTARRDRIGDTIEAIQHSLEGGK